MKRITFQIRDPQCDGLGRRQIDGKRKSGRPANCDHDSAYKVTVTESCFKPSFLSFLPGIGSNEVVVEWAISLFLLE
jgi:hypothetical protein